jgi:hypothetical protein
MEIGADSFVAATIDPKTGLAVEPARHLSKFLDATALANPSRWNCHGTEMLNH